MPSRTYSPEEVQAILARALEGAAQRGDALTHDDLQAIGRELGVSEKAIDDAAAGIGDELAVKRIVDERVRRSRRGLSSHLLSFLLVNALLAVINLTLTGMAGPFWFLWSVFGWGIGLAFHARAALLPDREAMAESARRKLERDREKENRRARRDRMRAGGKRIESAVEDVVAETLGVVADAISESRRTRGRKDGVRVDPGSPRQVRFDRDQAAQAEADAEQEGRDGEAARRRRR